jgi:putative PEP-CTERM system histidine kinase
VLDGLSGAPGGGPASALVVAGLPASALLHAGCAAAYGALALLVGVRGSLSRTGALVLIAALATAGWAASVAASGGASGGVVPVWLEAARGVAWYGLLLHLFRRSVPPDRALGRVFSTMGLVLLLLIVIVPGLDAATGRGPVSLPAAGLAARLALALGSILLTENLYFNTPADRRWNVNLLCVALGGMFLYDLVLYADAILFRRMSEVLFAGRASVSALVAPLIAVGVVRNRKWKVDIHVSRRVVFHSATLLLSGLFLLGLAAAGEIFRRDGPQWGTVAEITLISGGVVLVGVLLTSGTARARVRTVFVDNFFTLRYDYREEWMRCIATLSSADAMVGLHTRAIRAVTQIVDSPAGALFVRDQEGGAFLWAGSWNMPAWTEPVDASDPVARLFDGGGVADLTPPAGGVAPGAAAGWPRAWLAVPLDHLGTLIGFVVVARSRSGMQLDREARELLRIVGREVATHVAEQRAARVLTQARQVHEYSKRFAFVVHDIKNVSGQLSMLLANAEVHAANPEFQRDMLATVRASVARINGMLKKMQAHETTLERTVIVPLERLPALLDARRDRARIEMDHDGRVAGVVMDQDAFDAVLTHLLDNAAEASAAVAQKPGPGRGVDAPDAAPLIRVRVRHEAASVFIDLVDRGPGMSPEFIRDRLFSPFASTKREGHGIGAFQARELLRAAGGDLFALSREGEGTTMRILLPTAGAPVRQERARQERARQERARQEPVRQEPVRQEPGSPLPAAAEPRAAAVGAV